MIAFLRSKPVIKSAFVGDFHEGQATDKAPYPYCVWTPVVPGVNEDTWGERTIVALADVVAVSRSQVEASNLDQLVGWELDEAPLNVIGQRTLICYRVGDIRMTDSDEEGHKVYRFGGSYEIQTSQVEGVRQGFLTLDAVIA
jgi:hypothetical protein